MNKSLLVIFIAMVTGIIAGRYVDSIEVLVKTLLPADQPVYLTRKPQLLEHQKQSDTIYIGWNDLLPEEEKHILEKYQKFQPTNPEDQILRSIQASNDSAYLNAIYSMNTVENMAQRIISIPGYIVPIELSEQREVSSLFLVPYFGACLHYPPPAPNQMIYIRLDHAIPMPDINQAYRVSGLLSTALFEDLLGTSAYSLELITMNDYSGQPDDFRQH